MSVSKVIDAIMRLTGEELPEGESVLITRVPGGELQVLRLLIRQTSIEHQYEDRHSVFDGGFAEHHRSNGSGTLKLEAHILEQA